MESYRIIILPWPQYTQALNDNDTAGGGELIEGESLSEPNLPRLEIITNSTNSGLVQITTFLVQTNANISLQALVFWSGIVSKNQEFWVRIHVTEHLRSILM